MILLGVLFLIVVVPGFIPPLLLRWETKLVSAQHTIISFCFFSPPKIWYHVHYKTTCVELFVSRMMVDEETLVIIHYN